MVDVVTLDLWCAQCQAHTEHHFDKLEKRRRRQKRETRDIVCQQCDATSYKVRQL